MIPLSFIALCGHPQSGKTEVQKILHQRFDVTPVDDAFPLRDFAMRHLGLSEAQVFTQEGKDEIINVCGEDMQVRTFLGDMGKALTERFGANIFPELAVKSLDPEDGVCSFGSVRYDQGWYYKKRGGIVIEVKRSGYGPSGNDFDEYDFSAVDAVLFNDGTLEDLELSVEILWRAIQRGDIGYLRRAA